MKLSTAFSKHLDHNNRWVSIVHDILWDGILNIYLKQLNRHKTSESNINPRVVLGAIVVKKMMNLSDEETIQMICENLYNQYFFGFVSFPAQASFDSNLFVQIRKRLGMVELKRINDAIYKSSTGRFEAMSVKTDDCSDVVDSSDMNNVEHEDLKGDESDKFENEQTTPTGA